MPPVPPNLPRLPFGQPLPANDRAEMRDVLEDAIQRAGRKQLRVRVPGDEGLMQRLPGLHFHFKPEVFLQMQGRTVFRFPKETIDLRPGDLCVVPAGLPHGETVFSDPDRPFRNLVAGFYSNTLSLHLAHEAAPQRPDIEAIEFFDLPNAQEVEGLTLSVIAAHRRQAPARDHVLRGLVTALLGMFESLVATTTDRLNTDVGKVFHVKWIVREQFSNTDLSVKTIAERLQCSPDYLSHLFHSATGEKLIHYIHRIRIEGARLALESTPLHISEIAFASGFDDAGYFARVFKKHCGESPADYRARLDALRAQGESRPKTIYFDRVDYSPGQPVATDDDDEGGD
jgi:AraC-like DNA-binding protein